MQYEFSVMDIKTNTEKKTIHRARVILPLC
jgi:hypothetical protein